MFYKINSFLLNQQPTKKRLQCISRYLKIIHWFYFFKLYTSIWFKINIVFVWIQKYVKTPKRIENNLLDKHYSLLKLFLFMIYIVILIKFWKQAIIFLILCHNNRKWKSCFLLLLMLWFFEELHYFPTTYEKNALFQGTLNMCFVFLRK